MTRATKPVWRFVSSSRGDMAVAITPAGILIRRKGNSTTYGPIARVPKKRTRVPKKQSRARLKVGL